MRFLLPAYWLYVCVCTFREDIIFYYSVTQSYYFHVGRLFLLRYAYIWTGIGVVLGRNLYINLCWVLGLVVGLLPINMIIYL